MKILDVGIVDPRDLPVNSFDDRFGPVELHVKVDEAVWEQGDPIMTSSNWTQALLYRAIPCGPFFAVEHRRRTTDNSWDDLHVGRGDSTLGKFNKTGIIGEQLISVVVETPEESLDLYMAVTRARRLMRKHLTGNTWNIICDEQAALQGFLKWRVERTAPVCYGGAVPGRVTPCNGRPTSIFVYKETHLNLCVQHLKDHQRILVMRRTLLADI